MYKKIILTGYLCLNLIKTNCSDTKPIMLSDIVSEQIYNLDQLIIQVKQARRPLRMPQLVHQANINNKVMYYEGLKSKLINCWNARDEWQLLKNLPSNLQAKTFDAKPDFDTPVLDSRITSTTVD